MPSRRQVQWLDRVAELAVRQRDAENALEEVKREMAQALAVLAEYHGPPVPSADLSEVELAFLQFIATRGEDELFMPADVPDGLKPETIGRREYDRILKKFADRRYIAKWPEENSSGWFPWKVPNLTPAD